MVGFEDGDDGSDGGRRMQGGRVATSLDGTIPHGHLTLVDVPGIGGVEAYTLGKLGEGRNEDAFFVGPSFVAVIDGATDKTGHRIDGMTGGRFVARIVAAALADLAPDASIVDGARHLTDAVDAALREAAWPDGLPRPMASAAILSVGRREVWPLGDCPFRIGDRETRVTKPGDRRAALVRRRVILDCLAAGATPDQLLAHDPGRAAILPELLRHAGLANVPGDPDAYPALNGRPVPAELLPHPVAVPRAVEVILASDGFEALLGSFDESGEAMDRLYREDPLRIGASWADPTTKGLASSEPGTMHDDRTWLRVPPLG